MTANNEKGVETTNETGNAEVCTYNKYNVR